MNSRHWLIVPVLGMIAVAAGCSHTLGGAQQDVSHDTQAVTSAAHHAGADVDQAAHNAGADVHQAAANAKAATVLTPAVKLAIVRDPVLNDTRNHITVHTDSAAVHLTGHVISADMITRATEDASKVLSDHHAAQTVDNALTVTGS